MWNERQCAVLRDPERRRPEMNPQSIEPPSTGNAVVGCFYAAIFDLLLAGVICGVVRLIQFFSG